ncbi:MAG: class I SAM-dependent methyltransferase [Beijerinckiaceae bacterium]
MTINNSDVLEAVKKRIWFYKFDLPDGTSTQADIPADVLRIHTSRRDKLVRIIKERVPNAANLTAIDFASHEGYYSIELARHFRQVRGIEIRPESIAAARLITQALGISNIEYTKADLQHLSYRDDLRADFVLVYGLLYHLENPIHTLRLASQLSHKHILIETQVFPYNVSGKIEDGHYLWQREVCGIFGLSPDYSSGREGGSTDLALVPSLNALLFLLHTFGFADTCVIAPEQDDYEQFRRGSRVIVYGAKIASP